MASIEGKRGTPRRARRIPAESGPVGLPDADQQRRDLRQRPADHPQRRRLVRRHRHREEQGHQGLRPGRQGQQHRADRGADGHAAAARSSRRSAAARPTAARSRRCRPAARPAAASRPSCSTRRSITSRWPARLDHGLRRHDRHGRDHQHGGRGPVLHGVLHGRVVRQVHPLPRRHRADAPAARPQIGEGEATAADLRAAGGALRHGQAHQPVRPRPDGAEPGAEHAALLPRTSTRRSSDEPDRATAAVTALGRLPKRSRRPRLDAREAIDHGGQDPHDRRQAGQRRARTRRSSTRRARPASRSRRSATSTASPTSAPAGCAWSRSTAAHKLLPACVTDGRRGHGGPDRHASGCANTGG